MLAKEWPKNEKFFVSVSFLCHSNVFLWQEHWPEVGEGTTQKRKVSPFCILAKSFQCLSMARALVWCWRRNEFQTKSISFLYPFYIIPSLYMARALDWCWRRNEFQTKNISFLYPFYIIPMSLHGKSTGLKLAKERPKNEKYFVSVSFLYHSNVFPWQEHWPEVGEGTTPKRKMSRYRVVSISE